MSNNEDKSRQAKTKSAAKLADYYQPATAKRKADKQATDNPGGTAPTNGHAHSTNGATRLLDFNGLPATNTTTA